MQSFPWRALLEWYGTNGRYELPWRNYDQRDEKLLLYRIWISEIFLQQTQVSRVIGYFEKVLSAFPSIESLARTDYETFFPYYQGLGYYSRARNILKTAQIVHETYHSRFPKEQEKLRKLPGVGPYTANALLAFGYGEPYLAWDTNLEKVFSRYYKGRKDEKLTMEEKKIIEKDFQDYCIRHSEEGISLRDEGRGNPSTKKTEHWIASSLAMTVRNINNALMDFAALADLKNREQIDWEKYPIQKGIFFETKGNLEPKEVKKSLSFPTPDATVIVTLHQDHKIYYSAPDISSQFSEFRHPEGNEGSMPLNASFIKSRREIHELTPESQYTPFLLPPALHRDIRKYVQDSFRTNYALELSVRPIHKKWIDEDGKPYVEVNAQIQAGVPKFEEYEKKHGVFVKLSRMV